MDLEQLSDQGLEQAIRDVRAQKGLDSLFYLAKDILEHNLMSEEEHKEICDLVQKWKRKNLMFLMPRGTYKSSIITDSYITQRILKDPNIRILVFSETYTNAEYYVSHLREHLEAPRFVDTYGNLRDDKFWRAEGFRVNTRTKLDKEPTVMPGGIDKPATGKHFNLIICEDILGETNTNTCDQLEKVKKRFEELSSLLVNDPDSMILIVGTMWDEEDVYADIIMNREGVKDWEELLKKKIHIGKFWNIYIRRAKEPDGTLNFPNALPQEKLDKVANDQSLRKHRLQYYNDLAMNHDTIFKQDWRDKAKTLWEELEKDSKGFPICPYKVLLVDPAISKNKDADYSGIIPLGIKGNIKVILDAYQERLDALELMDTIFSMCEQHGIRRVFIEISGFQRVICTLLRQECRKRGTYLNITEYNPGTKKTKEERIETLVPKFRQGLIAYSRNFTDLDNQLKKFPNFSKREHDDLIDALSIAELALTDNMFNLDISKYAKEDLEIKDNFLFPSLGM